MLDSACLALLHDAPRIVIGLSGGVDSIVLAHYCSQHPLLSKKLLAIHVNHGLNSNASLWVQHCEAFCEAFNIPLLVKIAVFDKSSNIEEGARTARYALFQDILQAGDVLLLAHHQDDQAETVLLQLLRGTGIEGLAAMPVQRPFGSATLYRPFLSRPKNELLQYAKHFNLSFVEDDSNTDTYFSRNFIRHEVLPLLQTRWHSITETLARTAGHCQEAILQKKYLAYLDAPDLNQPTLALDHLLSLELHRLKNVLQVWLKQHNVKLGTAKAFDILISTVILAKQDSIPVMKVGHRSIRRYHNVLYIVNDTDLCARPEKIWEQFPLSFCISDIAVYRVHEQQYLIAVEADTGFTVPPGAMIRVRYRQGGELWHWKGQTKSLKKCFQAWGVPPWMRDQIPLVYVNDRLVCVVGYGCSEEQKSTMNHSAFYQIKQSTDP